MDRGQIDTLARLVSKQRSRRAALATLFGAALLRQAPIATAAKRKNRRRRTARVTAQAADDCYPGRRCTPGKGKNTSGCDFSHSTVFQNRDVRGSNLSDSNFFGADLRGADFRGANLSGGCFVGANLRGAKLGSSVNLHQAVFCNTTMPDGRIDDSGCEGKTPCCHLRLQDCPDKEIGCFQTTEVRGICGESVGNLGTVGTCWDFPCCEPCDHPDQSYWTDLCNQAFADECNGQCIASDPAFISCWDGCLNA
jgi:hypothetical protein